MIVKKSEITYPIFTIPIEEHNSIKDTLLEMIERQNKITLNDKDQHCLSDWSVNFGEEREYFVYLQKFIHKYVESVILDNSPNGLKINIDYERVWFQRYKKYHYHEWHNHGGCWAMIYFLELSDPNLSTEFFIPFNKNTVKFNTIEGDLLLFPGNLWHRSCCNASSETKTVIVSNVSVNS